MDSILWKARLRQSALTRWIITLRSWQEHWLGKLSSTTPRGASSVAKRQTLLRTLRTHNLHALIETGTYFGDTAHYIASRGYKVITVEVEPRLAALARERFKLNRKVTVLQGDSGRVMAGIAANLDRPALFYLDGHYSGGITGKGELETPIVREVETILAQAPVGSFVIVDDARCFGSALDYPSLSEFVATLQRKGVVDFVVRDDTIRFAVPERVAIGA